MNSSNESTGNADLPGGGAGQLAVPPRRPSITVGRIGLGFSALALAMLATMTLLRPG